MIENFNMVKYDMIKFVRDQKIARINTFDVIDKYVLNVCRPIYSRYI